MVRMILEEILNPKPYSSIPSTLPGVGTTGLSRETWNGKFCIKSWTMVMN